MKKILIKLCIGFIILLSYANGANAATIFGQNIIWNFKEFPNTTINPDKIVGSYFDYEYNKFDWTLYPFPEWGVNSGIAFANDTDVQLQTIINLDGLVNNLQLKVGIDDSFSMYVNGNLFKETYGNNGFVRWNYTFNAAELDSSLFNEGLNYIHILVNDNQGSVDFDMELTGNIIPNPEPSSILLGLMGIAGGLSLRKKN